MKSTPRHKNVNYDFVARTLFFHMQNSPTGKLQRCVLLNVAYLLLFAVIHCYALFLAVFGRACGSENAGRPRQQGNCRRTEFEEVRTA